MVVGVLAGVLLMGEPLTVAQVGGLFLVAAGMSFMDHAVRRISTKEAVSRDIDFIREYIPLELEDIKALRTVSSRLGQLVRVLLSAFNIAPCFFVVCMRNGVTPLKCIVLSTCPRAWPTHSDLHPRMWRCYSQQPDLHSCSPGRVSEPQPQGVDEYCSAYSAHPTSLALHGTCG